VRAVEAEEHAYYQQTGQYIPATQDNLRVLLQRIGAPEQAAEFVWGLMLSYAKGTRQASSPREYVRGKGDLLLDWSAGRVSQCRYELVGRGIVGELLDRAVEAEEHAYYQQTVRYIDTNHTNLCILMERIGAEKNPGVQKLIWEKMQKYMQDRHDAPLPQTEGGSPLPPPQPGQSSEAQTQVDPETCQQACRDYQKCMQDAREAGLLSQKTEERSLSLGASTRATCSLFRDLCPMTDCE
jgi:hypothetical protein